MQQLNSHFAAGGLRLELSGLNTRFIAVQGSFAKYASATRDMLGKIHSKRAGVEAEKIITGNAPFELQPKGEGWAGQGKKYRRGVLLVHGLTDSPYFMRYLGVFFQEQGFKVMAILLPGHGTQPGDLLEVTWHEWLKAVAFATDRLVEEVDEVYLAGFSAGGALSIHQSLIDTRVHGLFLYSPALKITSRAAWANMHKLYSWLVPTAKWVDVKPDRDNYKYESLTKNAVYQTYQLIKTLSARLQMQRVDVPVFAAASVDDMTVDCSATIRFMTNATHPINHFILYGADVAEKPIGFPAGKLEWVNSTFPEQKILSSSHTAIVLPPEDAYYGVTGEYANCAHYYASDMEKYEACMSNAGSVLLGEVTAENLQSGVMRRLMYNPNFAALKISMQNFIESLP